MPPGVPNNPVNQTKGHSSELGSDWLRPYSLRSKQIAGVLINRHLELTVLIFTVSMGKQQPNLERFQSCFLAWLDFCENGFRAKEVTRVGRCCCTAVSLEL